MRHNIDRITALRRSEEQRVAGLQKFAQQSSWLTTVADKENKADAIRKANMKAGQDKVDNERRLLAEKNENTKRDLAAKEISQRMLLEMKLQRDKQQAKELEIQRICSQSEELKDLERQLKIAYVNKERAAQHQEAMLLSKIENERAAQLDWQMEKDRILDLKQQEDRERERRQKLATQKEGEEFVVYSIHF